MKRFLIAVLLGSLMMLAPTAEAGEWRWNKCRFQTLEKANWTVFEIKQTIRCAVRHWPVSGGVDKAFAIAQRESGFYWHATNSSSGACGIYQHLPQYWPIRIKNFNAKFPHWDGGESCYNARSNVIVAIWMASTGGWGPWGG